MFNLFDGLEKLGFMNIDAVEIYKEEEAPGKGVSKADAPDINPEDYLYDKTFSCPVCGGDFMNRIIRNGKVKLISTDSDLRSRYDPLDPLFYEVILCTKCGYAALHTMFSKITEKTAERVLKEIRPVFKPRTYPAVYDIETAIERLKLALYNCVVRNARDGEKAYICLKLAWLYRDLGDTEGEAVFQKHAVTGFISSLQHDNFPLCGLDENLVTYIVAETLRRLGDFETSLRWFSKLAVTPNLSPRLKDRVIDQRAQLKKDRDLLLAEIEGENGAKEEPVKTELPKPKKAKHNKKKSWLFQ